MNVPRRPAGNVTGGQGNLGASGVASGKHQGLRRPADDQRIEQALDDVGLEDQGEVLEDDLRDRRSRGAPPSQHLRSDIYDDERGNKH